jgi:hypothetical protein
MVPHPEGEDDLLARVREVNGLGLSGLELRVALLEQLPCVSGPHERTVRHPADLHRNFAWHSWTPDLLVKRYRDYLGMIERWRLAHPDRVRRYSANPGIDLPDLDDGDGRSKEESAWDRATHGRQLFDVHELRHEHYRQTGEWLPLSEWRTNEWGHLVMVERGPLREYPTSQEDEQ